MSTRYIGWTSQRLSNSKSTRGTTRIFSKSR